jgi:hypothetical protein
MGISLILRGGAPFYLPVAAAYSTPIIILKKSKENPPKTAPGEVRHGYFTSYAAEQSKDDGYLEAASKGWGYQEASFPCLNDKQEHGKVENSCLLGESFLCKELFFETTNHPLRKVSFQD